MIDKTETGLVSKIAQALGAKPSQNPTNAAEAIGEKIKETRKGFRIGTSNVEKLAREKGFLTYLQLAAASGIVGTTANRWWYNDRSLKRFDSTVLVSFCLALDCEIGDILSIEKVPE